MLKPGLIQIYTGPPDFVNYAPLGLMLRASGRNLRTLYVAFKQAAYGDVLELAASRLEPNLVVGRSMGMDPGSQTPPVRGRVLETFQNAQASVLEGRFDMVILDGLLDPGIQEIVEKGELLEFTQKKPAHVELVLTGSADDEIIQRADLVTDMRVHKGTGSRTPAGADIDGSIEVVTGNGKGKTTHCLGKAMVAALSGVSAFVLQVIKSPRLYGEIKGMKKIPNLETRTMGEGFLDQQGEGTRKRHAAAARRAWEVWLRELYSMKYGLLVLDEINIATYYHLISPDRVREMLFLKPEGLHLMLSGREAHPEVAAAASTVIEMKEIKHPYKRGVKAREGIEF